MEYQQQQSCTKYLERLIISCDKYCFMYPCVLLGNGQNARQFFVQQIPANKFQ